MHRSRTLVSTAAGLVLCAAGLPAQEPEGAVLRAPGLESLTLGGQLRVRLESRDTFPPTTAGTSASTQLGRLRVHMDAQLDSAFGAFVELQESINSQGSPDANGEVHQAYGRWNGALSGVDLQVGRMELSYGNQRMVSPLDWSNTGRAWDGARAQVRLGEVQVDSFLTKPVAGQGSPGGLGTENFSGVYLMWEEGGYSLDAYVFRFQDSPTAIEEYTYGGLAEGSIADFSYSLEAAFQSGDHGALKAGGNALAARVGWSPATNWDLELGYEYASGDSNPADGKDETFRPLFDFSHAWHGQQDIVVWRNLEDIIFHAGYRFKEGWKVYGDLHLLSQAETSDALYTGLGGTGAVASGTDDSIGTELDLGVKGALSESADLWVGVSQFWAGDAILNGDDQLWLFAQVVLNF